jgi:nicotinamidase-related amidase
MKNCYVEAEPYTWPHDQVLKPKETALLIIDMQRDFCDPSGYVALMGYDLLAVRSIIPRIAKIRDIFTKWGGLVIYTREGHRPDLSDLPNLKKWRSRFGGVEIGHVGPLGRILVRGEGGWQIVPELEPRPGEICIDKPGYSAFYATDLDRILSVKGIKRIILTGTTTDICVHSTLRSAVDRGYECLLVDDACAATVPEHHRAAVGTVATEGGIFGAICQTAELCRGLEGSFR